MEANSRTEHWLFVWNLHFAYIHGRGKWKQPLGAFLWMSFPAVQFNKHFNISQRLNKWLALLGNSVRATFIQPCKIIGPAANIFGHTWKLSLFRGDVHLNTSLAGVYIVIVDVRKTTRADCPCFYGENRGAHTQQGKRHTTPVCFMIIIICGSAFMDTKFATEVKGVKYFSLEIHTLWQDTHSASKWISPESVAEAQIETGAGEGGKHTWPVGFSFLFVALGTVADMSDRLWVCGTRVWVNN